MDGRIAPSGFISPMMAFRGHVRFLDLKARRGTRNKSVDSCPVWKGKGPNKRREFFYWTDDGNLAGLRYQQWKAVFMEQKAHGFDVWAQPMVQLRLPMLFNLRSDPFERAQHEAGDYVRWFIEHAFVLVPAQAIVGQHLTSFQQFPPRQRPGSFSVEQAMEKLRNPPSSN